MKKSAIILVVSCAILASAGAADAAVGDITVNINDMLGTSVPDGDHVKADLWGVGNTGSTYNWHHMVKDASSSSVTWTAAEIAAELGTEDFSFTVSAWAGDPFANSQFYPKSGGLWDSFMAYSPTDSERNWDINVLGGALPPIPVSSGVKYSIDLGSVTINETWASINVSYKDCVHDVQPTLSPTNKAYLEGEGYSFSFNAADELLTITNPGIGFDETISARFGDPDYIFELERLAWETGSYDDVEKEFSVDIDFDALGLSDGDRYFVLPYFYMDGPETNVGISAHVGYVGHALNPITVPEPATMSLLALGGLALIRRKRK